MRKNELRNNFSGGEWTSLLDARSDLQKYDSACITMQNFRPLPWGGATYRPGQKFVGYAKYADRICRLLPFNYSTSLSFIIEMGDFYMRFWYSNGSPVTVSAVGISAWVSGHAYKAGDWVTRFGVATYYCTADVTSATAPEADSAHWSNQNMMEVPSPFGVARLRAVQIKQINAQLRLVHPAITPQTLTYTGLNIAWTLAATAFRYPVLRDQNATQAIKLNVAATTGATTLISNTAGTFNTAHVGSYWELQHLRPSDSETLDLNNQTIGVPVSSASIQMEGAWTFTTSQFWWGVVQVERSIDGGTVWTVIREFTAKSDQNFSTSGTEPAPQIGFPAVLYRITYTQTGAPFDAAVWVGTAPSQYAFAQASLESQDAYVAGLVLVTGFTDDQHVSVTVVIAPQSTALTYLWSEGAFSTYRGFPTTIGFYEQRLLYSGTTSQANTVWGSVTGDFDNFQFSDNDDGAVAFQPAVCQQNPTAWLATLGRVHLGTSGEEIIMASGNFDEALTPSNVTMRAQSFYGSTPIQPIQLQNSILFVERNGQRVREMRELSPYVAQTDFVAPDLTLLAEHITKPGIVEMDFGRLPDPLAYFVRSDGVMAVCTYNREQNVTAWARYVTAGLYESVAAIFGTPEDVIWTCVSRPVGVAGATVRCIEAFTVDPAVNADEQTNVLLDCAEAYLTGDFTPGADHVFSNHFKQGQVVTALVDGGEYPAITVGATGRVDFPANVTAQTAIIIGLPYTGLLSPMKPELQDQEGASQGKKRRIAEVVLRVRNSLFCEYAGGASPTAFTRLQFRSPNDTMGANTPLSDGIADYPLPGPWPDGNTFGGQLTLKQAHPFALTVLAISTKFDVF